MKRQIVICDIDGTINDVRSIVHLHTEKKYDEFTEESNKCRKRTSIINLITRLSKDHKIIFLTGRHFKHRAMTKDFLNKTFYQMDYQLAMRMNETDSSRTFKWHWLVANVDLENIAFALEDRVDVAKTFSLLSIETLMVGADHFSNNKMED